MRKYHASDKYKQKYKEKSQTPEFKKKQYEQHKKYYEKNRDQIREQDKKNYTIIKTAKSDEEKSKFYKWLDLHVKRGLYPDILQWDIFIEKYKKMNGRIKGVFRQHFEEYILNNFKITEPYKKISKDKKYIRGWRFLIPY